MVKRPEIEELRQAFTDEIVPFMAELGFRRGKRSLQVPPGQRSFGPNYQRRRGEHLDEILVVWRTYHRPWFLFEFWTSQTERMLRPDATEKTPRLFSARLASEKRTWLQKTFKLFYRHEMWFGELTDLPGTIEDAKSKLLDLDAYLRTGVPVGGLDLLDSPPVMTAADPEVAKKIK